MELVITNSFGLISKQDILKLEKEIYSQLPQDYTNFLILNNGGRPEPNIFKTKNEEYETDIQFFFGITSGVYNILDNYQQLDYVSKNYLPIALDSTGNLILLDLISGNICFFDRDIESSFFISDNFKYFLQSLYKLPSDETEFDNAVNSQNISYFEKMISNRITIDEIVNEYNQPLIIVSSLRNKLKLVKYCVEKGAKLNLSLLCAASNGHIEVVKFLISKGANINERDATQNNDTPLIQAAYGGFFEIVKLLIKNGANIHQTDDYGNNALNKAYWSDKQELISFMEDLY